MPHNSVTEPAPEHHSASDTVNGTENAHDHLGPPASSSPRALEPALHITTENNHASDVSPAVSDHARDAHSMTPSEYRNNVLRRVMAEWPRPITPQILRGRMAAFKEELCDANYVMEACACCAREKRRAKLRHVVFPSPCAEQPPDWLPFNAKEWLAQRDAWYTKVDALLNVDV